jgi:hypothetical protein
MDKFISKLPGTNGRFCHVMLCHLNLGASGTKINMPELCGVHGLAKFSSFIRLLWIPSFHLSPHVMLQHLNFMSAASSSI